MGIDPRLHWRFFSTDSMMLSLPPRDGPAPSNSAGIRAIGMAIMAAGIPPGTSGTSKIVVLCDDTIDTAVDGIVVLLPPSTTSRGEHDASNEPPTSVRLSVSYQPLVDGLSKSTNPSHELCGPGTCVALFNNKLGKPGMHPLAHPHHPPPPSSAGGVRVVSTPNANAANTTVVGGSNHIWSLEDESGAKARGPLSLLSLARGPAQRIGSTKRAHEPAQVQVVGTRTSW